MGSRVFLYIPKLKWLRKQALAQTLNPITRNSNLTFNPKSQILNLNRYETVITPYTPNRAKTPPFLGRRPHARGEWRGTWALLVLAHLSKQDFWRCLCKEGLGLRRSGRGSGFFVLGGKGFFRKSREHSLQDVVEKVPAANVTHVPRARKRHVAQSSKHRIFQP